MKVDDGLNSGVQIRSQTKDTHTGRVNGPQIEIAAGGAGGSVSGYVYGEACGGWMTPDDQRKPHKAFKNGEWNKYRVVAQGAKIQVWINGQDLGAVTDEAKFQTHPKGFIGLQVHTVKKGAGPFEVAWRNLRLRELK